MAEQNVTLKARYEKLNADRFSILERARRCAALTIPALLPPEGHNETNNLPTPYQGLGARGVNNLASKLLLALLPPNSPFFKLTVDDLTVKKLEEEQDVKPSEIQEALSRVERAVQTEVETQAVRVAVFEALKLLIATGDSLLYMPDDGGAKVYSVGRYVIKRDPMGTPIEIIIKESIYPTVLPEDLQDVVKAEGGEDAQKETVDLYTGIRRVSKNKMEVHQEVCDRTVPKSEGSYPTDKCPWIPLRWTSVANEDYGRGLVEENLGDFISLESLTQSIVEGAAAAAKIIFLVDPNGVTRAKTLAQARSGDFKTGREQDISVLQFEKQADLKVAMDTASVIKVRLEQAFLLNASVQRQGDRVTATEIRLMANELEDALGGVYSVLSQELQLRMINRMMSVMSKQKKLPSMPKFIKPMITTGLEALGRGHDLDKLNIFIEALSRLGPEVTFPWLVAPDFIKRLAAALGLETSGLVKTPEEKQAEEQQMQMQAMIQKLGPGAVQEMTKGMVQQQQ